MTVATADLVDLFRIESATWRRVRARYMPLPLQDRTPL